MEMETLSRTLHSPLHSNLLPGNPKDNFATILPHDWPAWTDKILMCARRHLKGDCYNNCARAISHVTNDNIPDKKRAEFFTFLSKCREEIAKKKSSWLLGLELSGIWPPKKPPDLPFVFDLNKKPLNPSTEAANDNGSQVELPPRMDSIPTTPDVPNPWIINVPQQEPQAPKRSWW